MDSPVGNLTKELMTGKETMTHALLEIGTDVLRVEKQREKLPLKELMEASAGDSEMEDEPLFSFEVRKAIS